MYPFFTVLLLVVMNVRPYLLQFRFLWGLTVLLGDLLANLPCESLRKLLATEFW